MERLSFGYVKILSGVAAGRIGRYVMDERESGKAKIYFGYHNDSLRFPNYRSCKVISKTNLTNNISKQDLIDRYYSVVQELNSVDANSNRKVKKYSAQHTDLITECNIIRGLLRERFSIALLNGEQADKNTILLFSFMDALWVNDFSLGLVEKGYDVAWNDHEESMADCKWIFKDYLVRCGTFIFIATGNSIRQSWFMDDFRYFKGLAGSGPHRIICVKADESRVPESIGTAFDLRNQFSDIYYKNFEALIDSMEG